MIAPCTTLDSRQWPRARTPHVSTYASRHASTLARRQACTNESTHACRQAHTHLNLRPPSWAPARPFPRPGNYYPAPSHPSGRRPGVHGSRGAGNPPSRWCTISVGNNMLLNMSSQQGSHLLGHTLMAASVESEVNPLLNARLKNPSEK